MYEIDEYDEAYAAEQLRRSRHPLRRIVKRFYLDSMLSEVKGPTIDFGCGAGQLLRCLPPGSVGLEVNPALVSALQKEGLNVIACRPDDALLELSMLEAGRYQTLVLSHVLEHFEDSAAALRQLFASCVRLGVERVIVVVPTEKGFALEASHKTFVTIDYLKSNGLWDGGDFAARKAVYFPLDQQWLGKHFVFHELKVVYERRVQHQAGA